MEAGTVARALEGPVGGPQRQEWRASPATGRRCRGGTRGEPGKAVASSGQGLWLKRATRGAVAHSHTVAAESVGLGAPASAPPPPKGRL